MKVLIPATVDSQLYLTDAHSVYILQNNSLHEIYKLDSQLICAFDVLQNIPIISTTSKQLIYADKLKTVERKTTQIVCKNEKIYLLQRDGSFMQFDNNLNQQPTQFGRSVSLLCSNEDFVADRDGFVFEFDWTNTKVIKNIFLTNSTIFQIDNGIVGTSEGLYSVKLGDYISKHKNITSVLCDGEKVLFITQNVNEGGIDCEFYCFSVKLKHEELLFTLPKVIIGKVRNDIQMYCLKRAGGEIYIIQQIGGQIFSINGKLICSVDTQLQELQINDLFVVRQQMLGQRDVGEQE